MEKYNVATFWEYTRVMQTFLYIQYIIIVSLFHLHYIFILYIGPYAFKIYTYLLGQYILLKVYDDKTIYKYEFGCINYKTTNLLSIQRVIY